MEIVIDTKRDAPMLCKLDENGLFKNFNPTHYRLISEKEYQRLKNLEVEVTAEAAANQI